MVRRGFTALCMLLLLGAVDAPLAAADVFDDVHDHIAAQRDRAAVAANSTNAKLASEADGATRLPPKLVTLAPATQQIQARAPEARVPELSPMAELERRVALQAAEPTGPAAPAALSPMKLDPIVMLYVREASRSFQVPEALLLAVIETESSFNDRAVSKDGAIGLMQLMPATARMLGVRDIYAPRDNVFGGTRYLSELLALFEGDVVLAVAAYNAGPTTVRRHGGIPPYRETRLYVRNVMNRYYANAVQAK